MLKKIKSMDDMCGIINDVGFLPFFANDIEGFSVEECIVPKLWYGCGDRWEAWEWKGPVIQKLGCAYGKFFKNKAGFISSRFFPDFANCRRSGYDFDARYDDGLAKHIDKEVYDILVQNVSLLSSDLKKFGGFGGKNGRKGFDGIVTRLQMQGYIVTENFEYRRDKSGNTYGWGVARYTTPEAFFGEKFTDTVYEKEPEQSLEIILKHLSAKLNVPESDLLKIIG